VAGDRTGTVVSWNSVDDEQRWQALTASEATTAFQVLRHLWAHPKEAVVFLKARIAETADARLATRACEVLELIASNEARGVLSAWAEGPAESLLAKEAKETLLRMLRT
jgi:hypothetical protein